MPDTMSHRVAHRHLESSFRTAGVVHVDPLGFRWGWFCENARRMHLQPYDAQYRATARVWLEDFYGRRAFEVDRAPPPGSSLDLAELHASVTESRNSIESAWLRRISLLGWIDYHPLPATILLYVGTRFEVRRKLRDSDVEPTELQVEPGVNMVYVGLPLNRAIWTGTDDGSDAAI